jgi:hypothetical protein
MFFPGLSQFLIHVVLAKYNIQNGKKIILNATKVDGLEQSIKTKYMSKYKDGNLERSVSRTITAFRQSCKNITKLQA